MEMEEDDISFQKHDSEYYVNNDKDVLRFCIHDEFAFPVLDFENGYHPLVSGTFIKR